MIPILTPAEASALDRAARERGISVDTLMENAGREVASAVVDVLGGTYGRRAVVVCGKGNNGGDGLVAARHLASRGVAVSVVLLEDGSVFRDAAAANLERLGRTVARVRAFDPGSLERELARADVAVDAIFGTGFRGVAGGAAASAIELVNGAGITVVSADIPSGVNGETGSVDGVAVRADVTVTFGAPKPGVILLPGAANAGILEVVDIGFPDDLIRSDLALVGSSDVAGWLPGRDADTHKRDAGYAVVVAGSDAMTGAVGLAASAAYRAGAGLVAVGVPEPILRAVQPLAREAIFAPLPATASGTISGRSERLDAILEQADALAIGPGMTTEPDTAAFVRDLVRSVETPVVLDADGLNAFAGRASELAERHADLVLTPHAGEFARLAEVPVAELDADRVGHVRKLAAQTNAIVLLKGSRTLIAAPDGSVRVSATGGPFLATGGTGDVLTGVIAGFLARGVAPFDAASAAAFVHGVAGRLAADRTGEGTVAGDVLGRLAEAMTDLEDR
jgi:ADP-dependent NAD(P)H-hydrate dehydratase / NAD(P)H-hydrate epimerase